MEIEMIQHKQFTSGNEILEVDVRSRDWSVTGFQLSKLPGSDTWIPGRLGSIRLPGEWQCKSRDERINEAQRRALLIINMLECTCPIWKQQRRPLYLQLGKWMGLDAHDPSKWRARYLPL